MKVQNYMTKDVFSVRADRKLVIADELMDWAQCRHVPVVDEGNHLVGLITHRDLLRASISSVQSCQTTAIDQRHHLAQFEIKDVMASEVASIDPEASINVAAKMMRRDKFGCLPVVNSRNELVGILTEFDLLGILEQIDLEAAPAKT